MSRYPLQRRSDGQPSSRQDPGFVQQGEVDWVSLSNAVVSTTVGTLRRLSGAGVQELTYVGALQLATRFKLSDIGYRRVEEAVEKTQFAPAFRNLAYFGFGYRSFIHLLADTRSGINCIALCASLAEAHSEELAARVVSSLWTVVGYPEDYQPSLMQFKCLIKACAGLFATCSFPETMRIMLGPYRTVLNRGVSPVASDPEEIAKALHGLFDISNGKRSRVTVVGGAACSFIAALAQWLFDFRIQVEDSHGKIMFVSSPGFEHVQVFIQYKETYELSKVIISESTFVLGSPDELLLHAPDASLHLIRTRVSWKVCLDQTFGQGFQDLLKISSALGGFLGGAARIYQALARGEEDVAGCSRDLFMNYVEGSYGRGFVQNISKVFPELDHPELLSSACSTVCDDVERACMSIKEAVGVFRSQCACYKCKSHNSIRHRSPVAFERTCILVLARTILELVTTMTCAEYASKMSPTEIGLYNIYKKNVSKMNWETSETLQDLCENVGLEKKQYVKFFHFCTENPSGVMANLIEIFTGYEFSPIDYARDTFRTAIADNGICVYMGCLVSMTTRPELLRKVYVIPGHIARGDKIFSSIWDCAATERPSLEEAIIEHTDGENTLPAERTLSDELQMTALVNERTSPGQLTLYYQILVGGNRVHFQPGELSTLILWRSGLITCSQHFDRSSSPNAYIVRSGWSFTNVALDKLPNFHENRGPAIFIWKHLRSATARLLAVVICYQGSLIRGGQDIFIRQGECLPCCIRSAIPLKKSLVHIV